MSYILDALKKAQAEENPTGVSLQPHRRGAPPWLAIGLVAVLAINLGLVGWIVWNQGPEQPATTDTATVEAPMREGDAPSQPAITQPVERPANSTSPAVEITTPQTTVAREEPAVQSPVLAPAPRPLVPVALRELPESEQILYNEFAYSTHIFTDDPSLCAIVVNGQRLIAGDTFQGLKVVAITEAGVVFEENRRGQRRQVEVSVLEQWESE